MSIGIYKYTNKINNKSYIGQSINILKRYEQHLYDAKHIELGRNATGIDYAINKYGIENFTFEIIELCSVEKINEREQYWINYYNSYHNGYNRTPGGKSVKGEDHPRAIFTEQDIWNIRLQYNQGIQRKIVFLPYIKKGFTERALLKIWNNETWTFIHQDVYTSLNLKIHKTQIGHSLNQIGLSSLDRAIKQDEINIWIQEYNNGLTINAIAKKYHRDFGTVQKYINNPDAISKVKYEGRKIKNIETGMIFKSISSAAKWAKCGATTLTRHLTTDQTAGKVPETNEPAHWIELS